METFKSFVLGFTTFIAMMFVQAIAAFIMIITIGQDSVYFQTATLFVFSLCTIIGFGIYYYIAYVKKNYDQGIILFNDRTILTILLLIILGIAIQLFFATVLDTILAYFPSVQEMYLEIVNSLVGYDAFLIIYVCLFGPLAEEIVFRGIIMSRVQRSSGFWIANLLQALFFALYHGNIVQGIYAFVLGAILGLIKYYGKTMLGNIILHISINITGYLVELFVGSDIEEAVYFAIMIISAVVMVGIIALLYKIRVRDDVVTV